MKKLKKLSNNKPSFIVVIIYGTVAVGKFTVANVLHKLVNYKFFHNHHTHDLARQLFERGSVGIGNVIENTRLLVFREIARAKINVVTTHTYSPNFVSVTGLTDPNYMKKIESIITRAGGRACFVHLVAEEKEILKRVVGASRNDYKKLKDKKVMREILDKGDYKISAPVKNNIKIDNTNLSPAQVSDLVIRHFKIM